jgi:murein DD-endopeptidase MepM/ murein hydrolase activator NlpD
MANEPVFVDGGELPGKTNIYYHYGLDFGGAEGLVEVVAATDGLVVSAAGRTLPEHRDSPAKERYDVVYLLDRRGWYYRYSHLKTIDVPLGARVRIGQRVGRLGKEGGSGGWSHLHFDITSRQPSGQWGIEEAYAYAWEAYRKEFAPPLKAVARPHRLTAAGTPVTLDGSKSWSSAGKPVDYAWTFSDGTHATGPVVQCTYPRPGQYSEVLQVTDAQGRRDWDFAVVQVVDPAQPQSVPPTIHPVYYPTLDLHPGDTITYQVRSFRTTHGQECWDFGDGSPPVRVKSDGNAHVHAQDGYAVTQHAYAQPGDYLVRVERSNERGETAIAHLHVRVVAANAAGAAAGDPPP